MGRVQGWGMATGLLSDATPTLPLALQMPPPPRGVACACMQTVTSWHLESGIRRPASWGKAKSDFIKVSAWLELGPGNYKLYGCPS